MKCGFLLIFLVGSCHGLSRKHWLKNLNFDNTENWDKNRVPCANDRIIIPNQSESVYVQTNTTLREMVLPVDGEVVLGQNIVINFASDAAVDLECNGEDLTYSRNKIKNWFDPANWKDEDVNVNVETERVPCTIDQVVFPSKSLFHVQLDQSLSIATMKIGTEAYTTKSLASFFDSPSGLKQFERINAASIELTQKTQCDDITGCVCGNDKSVIKDKICGLYECPNIACQSPLRAVGGCCNLCGGMLTMNYYESKFNMELFKQDMYDTYSSAEYIGTRDRKKRDTATNDGVDLYISKVTGDKIQMVLTDKVPGTDNGKNASDKARKIKDDLAKNNRYGVYNIYLQATSAATGKQNQKGDMSAGAVTGVVIAVIIILVIVIILSYMFVKRRPLSRTWFKKDEPLDASLEMAPGIAVVDLSFDNPMYDSPTKENFYMDPSRPFPNLDDDTSFSAGSPIDDDRSHSILSFSNPLPDDLPDRTLKKTAPAEEGGVKAFTNPLPEDLGDLGTPTVMDPIQSPDTKKGMEDETDA
ncbi:protein amnionless-like [Anneissia japonica]|uniref:protein amnionless-like n=1 Tax=Anneissia japonica TaxID=1529436 RepID=UPI001425960D|nr:protein amnionless-like [Anneissia japonica]